MTNRTDMNCNICGGKGFIELQERITECDCKSARDNREISRLRNVIQSACIGGTDAMLARWVELFPDAPVPTVSYNESTGQVMGAALGALHAIIENLQLMSYEQIIAYLDQVEPEIQQLRAKCK